MQSLLGRAQSSRTIQHLLNMASTKKLRLERGLAPNPIKVVVSGSGSVPETARMFQPNGAPALVFTTERIPSSRLASLQGVAEVHCVGETTVNFRRVVEILERRIKSSSC